MNVTIDRKVMEKVLAYLVNQPYKDVFMLMNEINASLQAENKAN